MKSKTLIGMAIGAVILVYLFVPIGRKYYKLHCQEKALKREVYRLTEKRVLLNNELRLLATDPVYVEQVARRVFNKAKEGEVVCKFVSPEELE